jgi:hypothetical protein
MSDGRICPISRGFESRRGYTHNRRSAPVRRRLRAPLGVPFLPFGNSCATAASTGLAKVVIGAGGLPVREQGALSKYRRCWGERSGHLEQETLDFPETTTRFWGARDPRLTRRLRVRRTRCRRVSSTSVCAGQRPECVRAVSLRAPHAASFVATLLPLQGSCLWVDRILQKSEARPQRPTGFQVRAAVVRQIGSADTVGP